MENEVLNRIYTEGVKNWAENDTIVIERHL